MKLIKCLVLALVVTSCASRSSGTNQRDYQIGAYMWQQRSGEYRALTYQAYNIARERVEQELQNKHRHKRAVVFDIDETLLDNSFSGAREIKEGIEWKESYFTDWAKLKQAIAIPGALEFVKFLEKNKIEIFYISNRRTSVLQETYENLKEQGFPVKIENVLLMEEVKNKESRRQHVLKNHLIVMLVGDNLADFSEVFEDKNVTERNALVDKNRHEFGSRFIMLPNALYGDWERALPKVNSKKDHLLVNP